MGYQGFSGLVDYIFKKNTLLILNVDINQISLFVFIIDALFQHTTLWSVFLVIEPLWPFTKFDLVRTHETNGLNKKCHVNPHDNMHCNSLHSLQNKSIVSIVHQKHMKWFCKIFCIIEPEMPLSTQSLCYTSLQKNTTLLYFVCFLSLYRLITFFECNHIFCNTVQLCFVQHTHIFHFVAHSNPSQPDHRRSLRHPKSVAQQLGVAQEAGSIEH